MAGPIQTAIGQALGSVAAVAAVGKKLNEDEKQAAKEAADKDTQKAAKAAEVEAKESQNKTLSGIAETLKSMQEKGFASPLEVIFDKGGQPLATSSEAATVVARQSLANVIASKRNAKKRFNDRKEYLIKRGKLVRREK